jgi:hypothetical protein
MGSKVEFVEEKDKTKNGRAHVTFPSLFWNPQEIELGRLLIMQAG